MCMDQHFEYQSSHKMLKMLKGIFLYNRSSWCLRKTSQKTRSLQKFLENNFILENNNFYLIETFDPQVP